jgi:hypothetical protein
MQKAEIHDFEAIGHDILRAKRGIAEIRRLIKELKYSPDQPRVPGGEPDGGQWTSDGGQDDQGGNDWRSVASRRNSVDFCKRQYEFDLITCRAAASSACYQQAIIREQACLNGHQIPPLNF